MKKAFITGITGQDGSYLADLLLEKGYEVHGLVRRTSSIDRPRIDHLANNPHIKDRTFFLHYGDLNDMSSLEHLIAEIQPDEIYHLAAQSHVRVSFDLPILTGDIDALGTMRLLEAIRLNHLLSHVRFYQASSSELFGEAPHTPQTEETPFHPRSPYGIAKLYAYWAVRLYRESYGLFAVNGILFNHESPRRGESFVTRKITRTVARIHMGLLRGKCLHLGNLDARRDWGYACDYVDGIWRMLQQEKPCDYVLATGETHTVREFLEEAFSYMKLNWRDYVVHDAQYERPREETLLCGDATRARKELNWKTTVSFQDLVHLMVDEDIRLLKQMDGNTFSEL